MLIDEEKQALEVAIQTERDGYTYYSQSAEKTSNPLLKHTLLSLSAEEKQHETYICTFVDNLMGERKEVNPGELSKETVVWTIFKDALRQPEKQEGLSKTDREIYKHAIDLEKKGITYYGELFEKAKTPRSKDFYKFLQEMEEIHLKVLENSVLFLENPRQYFSENESWILEG